MSAFFVGVDHVNAMLTAARALDFYVAAPGSEEWRPALADDPIWTEIGRHLLKENMLSLAARYPDDWEELMPKGFTLDSYRFEEDLHWLTRYRLCDAAELISSFEYQSCEHAGWRMSWTREFCGRLVREAARKIPKTTPSCWHYEKPTDAAEMISLSSLARR